MGKLHENSNITSWEDRIFVKGYIQMGFRSMFKL